MTLADPHAATPVLVAGAPLAEAHIAVVLVHGRGASAEDILGFSAALARPGVAFLAPQAAEHTWYPQRFLAPLAANEPWLTSALAKLESVRGSIATAGIADQRILWLGFSQGACLASEFVARHPRRWGGLVAAVGGRIGPQGTDFDAGGDLARTPVYLGCGDTDPHIPWLRVEESAAAFARQNAEVTLRRYPGFPHSVHPEAVSFARRLLEALTTS
ncbi:MAG: phospholipase/carboxylesterase [Acidobacteriota bacterium]|nr:phospholipase/carboxylesterase [Acidobacteriota bacterium]